MKRLVTIFLAVLGFSLTAEAQISVDKQLGALDAEQTKARINQIKRDSCYLYGEGTIPTKEEAEGFDFEEYKAKHAPVTEAPTDASTETPTDEPKGGCGSVIGFSAVALLAAMAAAVACGKRKN